MNSAARYIHCFKPPSCWRVFRRKPAPSPLVHYEMYSVPIRTWHRERQWASVTVTKICMALFNIHLLQITDQNGSNEVNSQMLIFKSKEQTFYGTCPSPEVFQALGFPQDRTTGGQSPVPSIENNLAVVTFFDFNTHNSPFFITLSAKCTLTGTDNALWYITIKYATATHCWIW